MIALPAATMTGRNTSRAWTKQVSRFPKVIRLWPRILRRVLSTRTTNASLHGSNHVADGMLAFQYSAANSGVSTRFGAVMHSLTRMTLNSYGVLVVFFG